MALNQSNALPAMLSSNSNEQENKGQMQKQAPLEMKTTHPLFAAPSPHAQKIPPKIQACINKCEKDITGGNPNLCVEGCYLNSQ
jgi:hypothetical protein